MKPETLIETKAEFHGWRIDDQQLGILQYIPKISLKVDATYQRSSITKKIIDIARKWSWISCGVLTVADRDGDFYIIDGQHRWAASMRRSDIRTLPCIVFPTVTIREEAAGFITANKSRKPITTTEAFNAMIVAGDPVAAKAERMVSIIGRRVDFGGHNAKGFASVGMLMTQIAINEEIALQSLILAADICEGSGIHNNLFGGLCHLAQRMPEGKNLFKNPYRQKLIDAGFATIMSNIANAKAFTGKTGLRVWALGVQSTLNHKSRTSRLNVIGDAG